MDVHMHLKLCPEAHTIVRKCWHKLLYFHRDNNDLIYLFRCYFEAVDAAINTEDRRHKTDGIRDGGVSQIRENIRKQMNPFKYDIKHLLKKYT
jgi:hypothetical protein